MDPILQELLGIEEENALREILGDYLSYLVLASRLAEHVKTAFLYPLIVTWFAMIDLIVMNAYLFPAIADLALTYGAPLGFVQQGLWFFNPQTWPLSLVIPGLFLWFAAALTRLMISADPVAIVASRISALLGIHRLASLAFKSRFCRLTGLFLRAGFSPARAMTEAVRFAENPEWQNRIREAAARLQSGVSLPEAVADVPFLSDILVSWAPDQPDQNLIALFNGVSENLAAQIDSMRKRTEAVAGAIGILLVGLIVLVLTVGFFDPYFSFIGVVP